MRSRFIFWIAVIFPVIFLLGCENLPFSMPGMKHKSRATWKTRDFPISKDLPTEITLKSKEDLIGNVTLDQRLYDGYQFGNLTFRPRNGTIVRIEKCWEDKLVELTQITWPNGESWLLFVWDHGKDAHLRTISLFDPRIQELFSLELDFGNTEHSETKTVKYRYSWKMSLPIYAKFLNFLEKVKNS